jgi:hypothetical protein
MEANWHFVAANWQSSATPTGGIQATIPMNLSTPPEQPAELISTGSILLQQRLPQELAN